MFVFFVCLFICVFICSYFSLLLLSYFLFTSLWQPKATKTKQQKGQADPVQTSYKPISKAKGLAQTTQRTAASQALGLTDRLMRPKPSLHATNPILFPLACRASPVHSPMLHVIGQLWVHVASMDVTFSSFSKSLSYPPGCLFHRTLAPCSCQFHHATGQLARLLLTQILKGMWVDKIDGKLVLGFGAIWWSVATMLKQAHCAPAAFTSTSSANSPIVSENAPYVQLGYIRLPAT